MYFSLLITFKSLSKVCTHFGKVHFLVVRYPLLFDMPKSPTTAITTITNVLPTTLIAILRIESQSTYSRFSISSIMHIYSIIWSPVICPDWDRSRETFHQTCLLSSRDLPIPSIALMVA